MRVVVGIATVNRRNQLTSTLRQLERLSPQPERVIIAVADRADVDETATQQLKLNVQVVLAPRGLCAQRNEVLRQAMDSDLIVFFDDDYYPSPDYLQHAKALFEHYPDVAGATGHPRLDGAKGPTIPDDLARWESGRMPRAASADYGLQPTYGVYGCNMVMRSALLKKHRLLFDERLPLYGWLEDLELSRRLARHGRIVASPYLQGVHLGTRVGRLPGHRLGYSQVVNPIYMVRKGSMHPQVALRFISRCVAKNAVRSLWPERDVDRRGRMLGNAIATWHLIRGRIDPSHILKISANPLNWRDLLDAARV